MKNQSCKSTSVDIDRYENDTSSEYEDDLSHYKSMVRHRQDVSSLLVYTVGIAEGLTHMASLALYYLFKDDLGLTPTQLSAMYILPSFPYMIRPVMAYITDYKPIFGTRRKHYLIFFSILQSVGFMCLALFPATVIGSGIFLFLIQFSSAFCLTIAEALVVESPASSKDSSAVDSVGSFVASKALATLLVSYLSGVLLEYYSKKHIFMVSGVFPLFITVCTLFFRENDLRNCIYSVQPTRELMVFLRHPSVFYPALYVLVLTSGPDYAEPLFYYLTNKMGYTYTFVGVTRLVYGLATVLGVAAYRYVFRDVKIKKMLFWSTIVSVVFYMSPALLTSELNSRLGIPDKVLIICGGFLTETVSELQFLPILAYISRITPAGLEASIFTAIITAKSVGAALSKINTAVLSYCLGITSTDFLGLSKLIIICGTISAASLSVVVLVPSEKEVGVFIKKYTT